MTKKLEFERNTLHNLDNFLFFTIHIFGSYEYDFGKSKKEDRNEKIEEDLTRLSWCPLCSSKDLLHISTDYNFTFCLLAESWYPILSFYNSYYHECFFSYWISFTSDNDGYI